MKRILSATLAALLVTSSVAVAAQSVATVQSIGGKVLVNKGEGFVPVVGGMVLSVGDSVLVGEESTATLAFGDCAVVLGKPTVMTVTEQAPCAGVDGVFVSPTADLPADVNASPLALGLPLPFLAVLGGTAAIAGIVAATKNKKSISR